MTDADFIATCESRSATIASAIGPVESDVLASCAQMTALTTAVGQHVAALVQQAGWADTNGAIDQVMRATNTIASQVVRIALLRLSPPSPPSGPAQ